MDTAVVPNLTPLTAMVRAERLDDVDLRDIAASVDAGEPEYIGHGRDTWHVMTMISVYFDVSAEYLTEHAIDELGWR